MQLPESFLAHMAEILPADGYAAFIASYDQPTARGLRFNRLKVGGQAGFISAGDLPAVGLGDMSFSPVPWCPTGVSYPSDGRPAKAVGFHSGLFYIQEPSAMCPVEVLCPAPGHRVLDLCAAPGGKSVQIAGALQGQGLLVSNDASPSRSRALVKNLERAGVTNAMVTTELPKRLAKRFLGFFDRVLVDAPCSGEGMFRRDKDAIAAYTENKPQACTGLQEEILRYAAQMVAPGGRLVYSTCTFNRAENEDQILHFLENHPDFTPVAIDHAALGIAPGLAPLPQAGRLFPHLLEGEGHFVALLEKAPGENHPQAKMLTEKKAKMQTKNNPAEKPGHFKIFDAFCQANLQPAAQAMLKAGHVINHGQNLYLQPQLVGLDGIRVARSGWFLGECTKSRFVPSQALAMGLAAADAKYPVELGLDDTMRYLKGESLHLPPDAPLAFAENKLEKPWVLITHQGHPLGWARLVQGRLKNNLQVGWVIN